MSIITITDDTGRMSEPYDVQDVPIIALVYDDVVASTGIAGTPGARSRLTWASHRAEVGTDALA
jgi:hypothetical protein